MAIDKDLGDRRGRLHRLAMVTAAPVMRRQCGRMRASRPRCWAGGQALT